MHTAVVPSGCCSVIRTAPRSLAHVSRGSYTTIYHSLFMLKLIGFICLLHLVVAKLVVDEKNHPQFISQHVKSFTTQKLGQGLCDGQTCCNVTSTESCPISTMLKDQSTLVLPGGETRCIYSYSTPFAFQVLPCNCLHACE